MTASKKNIWPYIISRMVAIVIIIVPLLTGVFVTINERIFNPEGFKVMGNKAIYFGWGYTFFYFTWSFFLVVLLPYSWLYVNKQLKEKNFLIKLLLFFALLSLMGLLLPDASIIDFYSSAQYPRILFDNFLLTVTICPLCNLALNRVTPISN